MSNWEHKVVEWKETHDFLMDLLRECEYGDANEKKICAAITAVNEKLVYWQEAAKT